MEGGAHVEDTRRFTIKDNILMLYANVLHYENIVICGKRLLGVKKKANAMMLALKSRKTRWKYPKHYYQLQEVKMKYKKNWTG